MNHSNSILSDSEFIRRLKQAHQIQEDIAYHLRKLGFAAWVPELQIRDKYENRRMFEDGADIFIDMPKMQIKIEVKAHKHRFNDHFDWPFRDIMIESVSALDRKLQKNPDTHCQIMFSRPTKKMFVIMFDTKDTWFTKKVGRSKQGRIVDNYYYATSKYNCISFYDYVQRLKQLQYI